MSEIKTKISTYNDVVDLFGEEKAADMLSEALDWSTIDPKNDKKNIMERKPLLLDPYMTYEDEDSCKHIVAGLLGDRDLDWASGYIDEEKIKNGQVTPADLKSALVEAIDKLGTLEGTIAHSGFCSYPAFTFDADVISQMRNSQEFIDANTPEDYKMVAVKVGYNFALVPKIELSGIETNATGTIVDISGKQYGLLAGKTFEDSRKLDAVLDTFPEYAIKDYKVPNEISVFIMPVQMYWKDEPSELIETNFSFEGTYGLAIDESVTFSGYSQNELVDMIGREDNGEDFVITGVGAGHYVGTCKKEPSKNKSVSEKTCDARESSGRLDADRNVDRNDVAKDKEVK